MNRIAPEIYKIEKRVALLVRLKEYFEVGYRDPGLLYLGGRYAVSLGMGKEACQWLEQLSQVFIRDGNAAPGYFPVGLLYLQVLPHGKEREIIIRHLKNLSSKNPELKRLLELAVSHSDLYFSDRTPIMDMLKSHSSLYEMSHSILKRIRPKKTNEELDSKSLKDSENMKPIQKLQLLSRLASQAYQDNNITEARLALEEILLIDGDQPDVLRNLITLATEQRDIEAYERYWKRCVRVLLWRIMRGDGSTAAWYDLVLFYKRVATIMDRECGKSPDEVSKIIRRPGFLSRWLEAMAGLVWLKCASQPWRSLQTGLGIEEMKKGQLGSLSLMKYWFRVFYPDLYPFLEVPENIQVQMPIIRLEANLNLFFDPKLKMLTRFLQWYKLEFALGKETNVYHKEAVFALGCFVVRLSVNQYIIELSKEFTNDYKNKNIKQVLNEALNLLFRIKSNELLSQLDKKKGKKIQEKEEMIIWREVADLLGVPELQDILSKELKQYLAMAYSFTEDLTKALDTLCLMLPELTKEEVEIKEEGEKEENQLYISWQNVLWKNIQVIAKENSMEKASKAFDHIMQKIMDTKVPAEINAFKTILLDNLVDFYITQVIGPKVGEALKEQDYPKARKFFNNLPDTPESIKKKKQDYLKELTEAEENYKLQKKIEETIKKAKGFVEKAKFTEARQVIQELPSQAMDIKDNLLGQVDEAEKHYKLQKKIEETIEKAKRLVEKAMFTEARRVTQELPSQVMDIKDNLLGQVDEAERQYKEIENKLSQLKQKLINKGFKMEMVKVIANIYKIDIDMSNPYQLYSLLKEVDEKILGNN